MGAPSKAAHAEISAFVVKNRRILALLAAKASVVLFYRLYQYYNKDEAEENEKNYQLLLNKVPPKTIAEFEAAALPKMSPLARVYYHFYCHPAATTNATRTFLDSLRLVPSILRGDMRQVDTSLTLFGKRMEMPVLIAPSAFHVLACPEGEVATAQGAAAAGAGYCYNWMLSSKSYEEVLPQSYGGVKWLHIYMFEEKDLVEASIQAALKTKAFSAVVLTCDHPHLRVQMLHA